MYALAFCALRYIICTSTELYQSKGFNYGFIEYDDPGAADRAMATLNGRRVHQAVSPIPPNQPLNVTLIWNCRKYV